MEATDFDARIMEALDTLSDIQTNGCRYKNGFLDETPLSAAVEVLRFVADLAQVRQF